MFITTNALPILKENIHLKQYAFSFSFCNMFLLLLLLLVFKICFQYNDTSKIHILERKP